MMLMHHCISLIYTNIVYCVEALEQGVVWLLGYGYRRLNGLHAGNRILD